MIFKFVIKAFSTRALSTVLSIALLGSPSFVAGAAGEDPSTAPASFVRSIPLKNGAIDTKTYLDQAWEQKARSGLVANSGLAWDSATRDWRMKNKLPDEAVKAIAHYASWTAVAARVGLNIADAYHEQDRMDELAKFYNAFLKTYFTSFGDLRRVNAPEVKQKLLGPELGPDSAQTLAWYSKQSDGSVLLRDCYQCNAEYFYPTARLARSIAALKPAERTAAMNQFVSNYVPLLAKDHLLRLHFAERMRSEMTPSDPAYKKRIMIADEILAVATAAELLGARSLDSKLIVIDDSNVSQLRDLIRAGVDRFQFSRTLRQDSAGHSYASYFDGDYDSFEDMDYARNEDEPFPNPAAKAKPKGVSWDISHFHIVPIFLWSLFRNKQTTGVDFPAKGDIDAISNQYAFHVFQGDFAHPLFTNFFDGSDGWYRVNYSGRSNYGVAPSHFCNMFDPSHACVTIAGIYSWGLLAFLNPDVARVQTALVDLARNNDPAVACFEPRCFRERYYHYADASFSFVDSEGQTQYPPALIVVLSELVLSFAQAPQKR
ncbi:MAG TPA: hypothetical protein VN025_20395 [Candidatus Dormibacteraeota bacterium]|jgi:hypothetical protein|nr:hypothetical protein [Candidatus Dormibacteraeota bacterium]